MRHEDRSRRSFISFVNSPNVRKERVVEIKREVHSYFEDNFHEANRSRPVLNEVDLFKLSNKDSKSLKVVFAEEEIKVATWSCNGNKSPNPDAFNFSFLQVSLGTV